MPPTWQRFDGVACECPVYFDAKGGAGGQLPAPLEWEACPRPISNVVDCQRVKKTWTCHGVNGFGFAGGFWRDASSGKAYLQLFEHDIPEAPHIAFLVIAELDGTIVTAHVQSLTGASDMYGTSVAEGKWLYGVENRGFRVDGLVAGSVGESLPSKYRSRPRGDLLPSRSVSADYIIEDDGVLRATSWDGLSSNEIYDPGSDSEGLVHEFPVGRRGAVFFTVESWAGSAVGTMVWTPSSGTHDFLRWRGDNTRGAWNFGTDGNVMAWTYGENKLPDDTINHFQRYSIMIAPFSTDPALVQRNARRLRSDHAPFTMKAFAVGCGFVGHAIENGEYDGGLLIARVEDGRTWIVPGGGGEDWRFENAVGFACNQSEGDVEVVASVANIISWKESMTVVRIPLASLGPGVGPD